MNSISTIKDEVRDLLTAKCGVAKEHIHYHASQEQKALTGRTFPAVGVIAADERFSTVQGMCDATIERFVPIEMRVWHTSEDAAMTIIDLVVQHASEIPRTHEIVSITHSDHLAHVTQYYAAFMVIRFTLLY